MLLCQGVVSMQLDTYHKLLRQTGSELVTDK